MDSRYFSVLQYTSAYLSILLSLKPSSGKLCVPVSVLLHIRLCVRTCVRIVLHWTVCTYLCPYCFTLDCVYLCPYCFTLDCVYLCPYCFTLDRVYLCPDSILFHQKFVFPSQTTVSVHNPSYYSRRFMDFIGNQVFKREKGKTVVYVEKRAHFVESAKI